ncbi:MAG: hypothetical protein DRO88_03960 [Promethearchaeia archaeon]|nr:MAG: hypothetical protein DRO88_03960 [Candidatus Lokiarchaeia archaeon]
MPQSNLTHNPEFINHPLLKKDTVIKRQYQQIIFATCARSNCLVVLPTGLGKTIIALLLAVHQWKDSNLKVVFLAPTRPLVEQHQQSFQNLINMDPDCFVLITGSITPEKREKIYQDPHVRAMFMTPQIVQNDLITGRFSFKNISLIIFDEAHRAVGDYAYTFIAKKYHQAPEQDSRKILAMTASPGKNKEKIIEVMQNLYLDAVEIRTESDPDVRPYIQEVQTKWIEVELPEELQDILINLDQLLKSILTELKKNGIIDTKNIKKITRKDLLNAVNELDGLISLQKTQSDLSRLLYCKKLLANAIRISHMKELIEAQGIVALAQFIQKNFQKVQDRKGGVSLRELFSSPQMQKISQQIQNLQQQKIFHPKLGVLLSLLQQQFIHNPESRVLVFCQFRDTVKFLVDHINQEHDIRAMTFVGQQRKGNEKGMSQKEQLQILQDFKSGRYNTLIATSVAEEGLDISECDMVVFFDVIPSEIRSIQRRGRTGRNAAGKVFILKTKGTREESYFWAEKHREKEMKRVLRELQKDVNLRGKSNNSHLTDRKGNSSSKSSNLLKYMQEFSQNAPKNADQARKQSQNQKKMQNNIKNLEQQSAKDDNSEITLENAAPFPSEMNLDGNPYVMVDTRETASPITRILSEMNVKVDLQTLPTGDYIVSQRCGIERKSIQDFVDSVKDGRLFNELIRLRSQFNHPILLLEGDIHRILTLTRASVLGILTTIILKFQIFLIQTRDSHNSAEFIKALAVKEQKTLKKPFSIRFKKVPEQIDKQLEHIIAGIPGINLARAQDLLREFRNLRAIFNASPQDLQKIHQIGPVLAEKIHRFATIDYFFKEEKPDSE